MAASVYVVAHYLAKPGKEDEVRACSMRWCPVAPRDRLLSVRLLRNQTTRTTFASWSDGRTTKPVDQHSATAHVRTAAAEVEGLVKVSPDVRRYGIL